MKRDGFALMELLAAMAVFTVGILAVCALFVRGTASLQELYSMERASQAAQSGIEEARAAPFAGLQGLDQQEEIVESLPGGRRRIRIENTASDGNLKKITVTVTWDERRGRERSVQACTLISSRTESD